MKWRKLGKKRLKNLQQEDDVIIESVYHYQLGCGVYLFLFLHSPFECLYGIGTTLDNAEDAYKRSLTLDVSEGNLDSIVEASLELRVLVEEKLKIWE